MDLSLVIPIYNEADNLRPLCQRIHEALASTNWTYEVVMIDDGSTDDSAQILTRLHAEDSHLKVLRFRRNFGQTAALAAGFAYAHGEVIVSLDGDLQNDPLDIPRLVAKLNEGYDVVSGWREQRVDNYWTRRLPSQVANWLIAKFSGVPLHDFGTTFKAYRASVVKQIALHGDQHRFIPALASSQGARIAEVSITNVQRHPNKSHYGLSRTWCRSRRSAT